MAGYTIKNLKEVEDSAPKFGMSPGLEGRFAPGELGADQSGISHQRLASGFRMPFGHKHNAEEEVYVVVGGSGRVKLDDDIAEIRLWDAVRVAPGTMRCFEGGPEGIEFIAFGARGLGTDDVEMTQDWWAD